MPAEKNHRKKKRFPRYLWLAVLAISIYPVYLVIQRLGSNGGEGGVPQVEKKDGGEMKEELTSIALAENEGVEAVIEREDGYYQLIAVVEGEGRNEHLSQALSVVTKQRQTLEALKKKREELVGLEEGTDEVDDQIRRVEVAFTENLTFMRENYGYILDRKYLLVPVESRLLRLEEDGGGEQVRLFESFEDYESFQERRATYMSRLEEVVKDAPVIPKPQPVLVAPKGSPGYEDMMKVMEENARVSEMAQKSDARLDPELKELREALIAEYGYDPELRYQVRFVKSALYVRRED